MERSGAPQETGGYWQTARRRLHTRRRVLIAGGALSLGVLAAACSGKGNGGSGSATTDKSGLLTKPVDRTKEAVAGGLYEGSVAGDITHFDSLAATDFQSAVAGSNVYSRLIRCVRGTYDKPADGTVEADAALSWEVASDGLSVTFKLRPNMPFDPRPPTNSRPLDAEDVVFSWNKFAARSNTRSDLANSASKNAPVESVTAVDKSTVTVKLAFPFAPILGYLAFIRYLLINPVESDGGYDPRRDMRGTGAWALSKYTPSVGFEYRKNPNWYDKPRPFLDGLNYTIVPEYATGLAQFKAGNLWAYIVRQEDILATKGDVPNTVLQQAGFFSRNNGLFLYFGYKPNSPFLDDRVRRAASMLIDRDLYIDTFANVSKFRDAGLDVPTRWNSHISAGEVKYWLDPKGKDIGDGGKNFQYDPSEAKKLLSAAGHSSAIQIPWTYFDSVYGPTWPRVNDVVKGMLEANGDFKINYNIVDYQTVWLPQYLYGHGLFDGICLDATTVFPDIDGHLYAHYHPDGQYYRMPSGLEGTSKLTDMVTQQRKENDPEKRATIIKDIQRYLAGNMLDVQFAGAALGFGLSWPWIGNWGVFNAWNAGGGSDGGPQETTPYLWFDKTKKSA
jgi:ABC-type transport system substrate-binding protein